ncbi:MAG: alpha-ketoacid dehydrogenase subunit beta [Coxiella sp. (in: Bacteria)]|nr:MAG: alpha-ketoacid dehydrogenase subunit beta [Coxiella sp. (in: g-proteobacteria)]
MDNKFISLVNAALHKAMEIDDTVLNYGLGMNDSIRIFGASKGLVERFGPDRVFDMPTAENGMTGVGVGLALEGFRPVLSHARLDFLLLTLDQIANSAAKWNGLFGKSVPLTIRVIVGRGWGQGPTHCQSLQGSFANIPGLKIVMPALAEDVYGLLLASIFDDNPVIFIEHRWLHNIVTEKPALDFVPLGKARRVSEGDDLTVVSMSYATIEAIHALNFLSDKGINCDLIDLRTVKPIDWDTIYKSVSKTGKLLVLDTGFEFCSIASEIVAKVSMDCFGELTLAPRRIAVADFPIMSSPTLANPSYTYADDIAKAVCEMLEKTETVDISLLQASRDKFPRDVPGDWFSGPF